MAEGIAENLKADEQKLAAAQLADPRYPGRRWVIRWDHVVELETKPGPSSVEPATKSLEPDVEVHETWEPIQPLQGGTV